MGGGERGEMMIEIVRDCCRNILLLGERQYQMACGYVRNLCIRLILTYIWGCTNVFKLRVRFCICIPVVGPASPKHGRVWRNKTPLLLRLPYCAIPQDSTHHIIFFLLYEGRIITLRGEWQDACVLRIAYCDHLGRWYHSLPLPRRRRRHPWDYDCRNQNHQTRSLLYCYKDNVRRAPVLRTGNWEDVLLRRSGVLCFRWWIISELLSPFKRLHGRAWEIWW